MQRNAQIKSQINLLHGSHSPSKPKHPHEKAGNLVRIRTERKKVLILPKRLASFDKSTHIKSKRGR